MVENELSTLIGAEKQRFDTNWPLVEALASADVPSDVPYLPHEEAMVAAYPPEELEANTDPDTLGYDYERTGEDNPYDWWSAAQLMACRFMRQAHDQGLAGLLKDLEYVRERATVQRLLAGRYIARQHGPARI